MIDETGGRSVPRALQANEARRFWRSGESIRNVIHGRPRRHYSVRAILLDRQKCRVIRLQFHRQLDITFGAAVMAINVQVASAGTRTLITVGLIALFTLMDLFGPQAIVPLLATEFRTSAANV